MIPRKISNQIRIMLAYFPVLVLTGARQTGKTTLLKWMFPDYRYISLDLPSLAALAEHDPESFFSRNPAPLIIDEMQYAPGLFRHLKAIVDADRHSMGRFILTGSQKFNLMKEVSESLAGRVAIVGIEGLSLDELGEDSGSGGGVHPDTFLIRGGFPELWRVPDFPADSFFSSYLATYLERDVRQILNVGNLRDFERFVRVLAFRNACELDMTAAGAAVGISTKTAGAWVSVLEASNLIVLLPSWHGNVGKRAVKRPKLFFSDTGLLAWLLGVSYPSLAGSPFAGAMWEATCFAEIRKTIAVRGLNRSVFFYRDNAGTEVDFLIIGDGARFIECKWTQSPGPDALRPMEKLYAAATASGNPELALAKGFILCRTASPYPVVSSIGNVQVAGLRDIGAIVG